VATTTCSCKARARLAGGICPYPWAGRSARPLDRRLPTHAHRGRWHAGRARRVIFQKVEGCGWMRKCLRERSGVGVGAWKLPVSQLRRSNLVIGVLRKRRRSSSSIPESFTTVRAKEVRSYYLFTTRRTVHTALHGSMCSTCILVPAHTLRPGVAWALLIHRIIYFHSYISYCRLLALQYQRGVCKQAPALFQSRAPPLARQICKCPPPPQTSTTLCRIPLKATWHDSFWSTVLSCRAVSVESPSSR
jgi:hypothetical protein